MKRNDWAGGFWAKAAAFLLAVVLVPVTLVYGAALAVSYSGKRTFTRISRTGILPMTAPRMSVFRSRTRRAPSSSITTAQATFP